MVNFFQLWVEFDGSHLVENVDELAEIEQSETEIPDKHVWSTYNAPSPYAEQEVTYKNNRTTIILGVDF